MSWYDDGYEVQQIGDYFGYPQVQPTNPAETVTTTTTPLGTYGLRSAVSVGNAPHGVNYAYPSTESSTHSSRSPRIERPSGRQSGWRRTMSLPNLNLAAQFQRLSIVGGRSSSASNQAAVGGAIQTDPGRVAQTDTISVDSDWFLVPDNFTSSDGATSHVMPVVSSQPSAEQGDWHEPTDFYSQQQGQSTAVEQQQEWGHHIPPSSTPETIIRGAFWDVPSGYQRHSETETAQQQETAQTDFIPQSPMSGGSSSTSPTARTGIAAQTRLRVLQRSDMARTARFYQRSNSMPQQRATPTRFATSSAPTSPTSPTPSASTRTSQGPSYGRSQSGSSLLSRSDSSKQ